MAIPSVPHTDVVLKDPAARNLGTLIVTFGMAHFVLDVIRNLRLFRS